MRGFVRPFARALLVAAAIPAACATLGATAWADPLADYVAARDRAIAASLAAAKADKSADEAVIKAEEAAMAALPKSLAAALGPVKFKGLSGPTYTLYTFIYDVGQPTRQLDGLSFADADMTTRVVVTPASLFDTWLAARAKDADAPAALAGGLKAAMGTTDFYSNALAFDGGYFQPYVDIPLTAAPGETAFAVLGLQSDEPPGDTNPNEIALVRIADGKAMVALTQVKLADKPLAACAKIWPPFRDKAAALTKVVEKDNKTDDPRWTEITRITDDGSNAYRACFAQAAPTQPFFATVQKRAEALLQTARGN